MAETLFDGAALDGEPSALRASRRQVVEEQQMAKDSNRRTALMAGSLAIAFAATMIAMWSLTHERFGWGGYNFAIALLALGVVVMVRARDNAA